MQPRDIIVGSIYLGVLTGYAVGKFDLDVRVMDMIRRQRVRIAIENAEILADTLEKRKLGIPVGSA
jgi:hypothetical protein